MLVEAGPGFLAIFSQAPWFLAAFGGSGINFLSRVMDCVINGMNGPATRNLDISYHMY